MQFVSGAIKLAQNLAGLKLVFSNIAGMLVTSMGRLICLHKPFHPPDCLLVASPPCLGLLFVHSVDAIATWRDATLIHWARSGELITTHHWDPGHTTLPNPHKLICSGYLLHIKSR